MLLNRSIFRADLETALILCTAVEMVNSCPAENGTPSFSAYVEMQTDEGNMDGVTITLGYVASQAISWEAFMRPIREARTYLESRPGSSDGTY